VLDYFICRFSLFWMLDVSYVINIFDEIFIFWFKFSDCKLRFRLLDIFVEFNFHAQIQGGISELVNIYIVDANKDCLQWKEEYLDGLMVFLIDPKLASHALPVIVLLCFLALPLAPSHLFCEMKTTPNSLL